MELPLSYATPEIFKLLVFIGITFPLSIVFFQRKVNQYLKENRI